MLINIVPANKKRMLITDNGNKKKFIFGSIGVNSYINSMDIQMTNEDEVVNIQIGNFCSIAYNVLALVNRNHDYKAITTSASPLFYFNNKKIKQKGEIIIGNDVWIGNNAILLSGIKIGNGAVIGAGTVVTKNVPPYAIVVGNPMRVINYRFDEDNMQKLQNIQWWHWPIDYIEKNRDWFNKSVNEFTNMFYQNKKNYQDINIIKKEKSLLFYPDFNEAYPVWKKVIIEYINKFSSEDNISLILRIIQGERFEQKINMISDIIKDTPNMPDILVLNDIIEDERTVFKEVNFYITTRSIDTIRHVEMADEFNVKILSGVDIPVFDEICN